MKEKQLLTKRREAFEGEIHFQFQPTTEKQRKIQMRNIPLFFILGIFSENKGSNSLRYQKTNEKRTFVSSESSKKNEQKN